MKSALIITAILIFFIAVFIFYNNRDHEKITELFVTSIILGLGAALLSMTFVLKPENQEEKFITSATVIYDKHEVNLQELDFYDSIKTTRNFPPIPYSRNLINVKQFYFQQFPDAFKVDSGSLNGKLYMEILSYSIMTDLFSQFSKTWTSTVEYIESPTGLHIRGNNNEKSKSKQVSWKEIADKSDFDIFQKFTPNELTVSPNCNLNIPSDSKISISSSDHNYTIEVENKISSFKIEINQLGSSRSAGKIGPLLNLPSSQNSSCATYTYEVKFNSEIKKWKSGHPDVKLHRKYHETIRTLLVENYSFDKYYNEAKEWYLMYAK